MESREEQVKLPTHWLHIGNDVLIKEKFSPVQNIPLFPKPDGGIWASPYQLNGAYRSEWHQFCMRVFGKTANQKGVIFTFKKEARMYVIDNQDDLIQLIQEVGEATDPLTKQLAMISRRSLIDFEKAQEKYDVIYLTAIGQYETRLPFHRREFNLYGWDCESCVILNPNVIGQQMSITLNYTKEKIEA